MLFLYFTTRQKRYYIIKSTPNDDFKPLSSNVSKKLLLPSWSRVDIELSSEQADNKPQLNMDYAVEHTIGIMTTTDETTKVFKDNLGEGVSSQASCSVNRGHFLNPYFMDEGVSMNEFFDIEISSVEDSPLKLKPTNTNIVENTIYNPCVGTEDIVVEPLVLQADSGSDYIRRLNDKPQISTRQMTTEHYIITPKYFFSGTSVSAFLPAATTISTQTFNTTLACYFLKQLGHINDLIQSIPNAPDELLILTPNHSKYRDVQRNIFNNDDVNISELINSHLTTEGGRKVLLFVTPGEEQAYARLVHLMCLTRLPYQITNASTTNEKYLISTTFNFSNCNPLEQITIITKNPDILNNELENFNIQTFRDNQNLKELQQLFVKLIPARKSSALADSFMIYEPTVKLSRTFGDNNQLVRMPFSNYPSVIGLFAIVEPQTWGIDGTQNKYSYLLEQQIGCYKSMVNTIHLTVHNTVLSTITRKDTLVIKSNPMLLELAVKKQNITSGALTSDKLHCKIYGTNTVPVFYIFFPGTITRIIKNTYSEPLINYVKRGCFIPTGNLFLSYFKSAIVYKEFPYSKMFFGSMLLSYLPTNNHETYTDCTNITIINNILEAKSNVWSQNQLKFQIPDHEDLYVLPDNVKDKYETRTKLSVMKIAHTSRSNMYSGRDDRARNNRISSVVTRVIRNINQYSIKTKYQKNKQQTILDIINRIPRINQQQRITLAQSLKDLDNYINSLNINYSISLVPKPLQLNFTFNCDDNIDITTRIANINLEGYGLRYSTTYLGLIFGENTGELDQYDEEENEPVADDIDEGLELGDNTEFCKETLSFVPKKVRIEKTDKKEVINNEKQQMLKLLNSETSKEIKHLQNYIADSVTSILTEEPYKNDKKFEDQQDDDNCLGETIKNTVLRIKPFAFKKYTRIYDQIKNECNFVVKDYAYFKEFLIKYKIPYAIIMFNSNKQIIKIWRSKQTPKNIYLLFMRDAKNGHIEMFNDKAMLNLNKYIYNKYLKDFVISLYEDRAWSNIYTIISRTNFSVDLAVSLYLQQHDNEDYNLNSRL